MGEGGKQRGTLHSAPRLPAMPASDAPALRFDDERARKQGGRISRMFDRIAPTYDMLNHLLSANQDVVWRRKAVAALHLKGTERVLDACTGTGDQAVALLKAGAREVVGTDFAPEMVRLAREKAGDRIHFQVADTTALPFPDAAFDVATVSFGVRNLEDLPGGLRELRRVLKPDGRLMVLECSRPPNAVLRGLYNMYFMVVLPLIGNVISGGADNAYAYLPRSVQAFPGPERFAAMMREAGFARVDITRLTGGIACMHLAHVGLPAR